MPLFGTKKKGPPPAKESISKLRETLDILERRELYLEKRIVAQVGDAKKFMIQKNKRAALMCLKRKQIYEAQASKLGGARMALEQEIMVLENANVSLEAMKAMKMGAASMKSIHQEMDADKVGDTMDDIKEQMDLAQDVQNVLAEPIGQEAFDDDELMSQLEQLEQESFDEQLLQGVPKGVTSTPIPKPASPTAAVVDEEAEFRALQAAMAT